MPRLFREITEEELHQAVVDMCNQLDTYVSGTRPEYNLISAAKRELRKARGEISLLKEDRSLYLHHQDEDNLLHIYRQLDRESQRDLLAIARTLQETRLATNRNKI